MYIFQSTLRKQFIYIVNTAIFEFMYIRRNKYFVIVEKVDVIRIFEYGLRLTINKLFSQRTRIPPIPDFYRYIFPEICFRGADGGSNIRRNVKPISVFLFSIRSIVCIVRADC